MTNQKSIRPKYTDKMTKIQVGYYCFSQVNFLRLYRRKSKKYFYNSKVKINNIKNLDP